MEKTTPNIGAIPNVGAICYSLSSEPPSQLIQELEEYYRLKFKADDYLAVHYNLAAFLGGLTLGAAGYEQAQILITLEPLIKKASHG